jgi:hypothetical protein
LRRAGTDLFHEKVALWEAHVLQVREERVPLGSGEGAEERKAAHVVVKPLCSSHKGRTSTQRNFKKVNKLI